MQQDREEERQSLLDSVSVINSVVWSCTGRDKTWQQRGQKGHPVRWLDLIFSALSSPSSTAAPSYKCTNRLGITTTVTEPLHSARENRPPQSQVWPHLSAKQLSQCWGGRQHRKAARKGGFVTYFKTDKADWSLEKSSIVFTQKH